MLLLVKRSFCEKNIAFGIVLECGLRDNEKRPNLDHDFVEKVENEIFIFGDILFGYKLDVGGEDKTDAFD
jgi:hypothetical protein